eukprot:6122483-Pyramimonas_sp.AAC.1
MIPAEDEDVEDWICIGPYDRDPEGVAGTALRHLLVDTHMCAINTFMPFGPTFFGVGSSTSRIDFLVIPQQLRQHVRRCVILHGA